MKHFTFFFYRAITPRPYFYCLFIKNKLHVARKEPRRDKMFRLLLRYQRHVLWLRATLVCSSALGKIIFVSQFFECTWIINFYYWSLQRVLKKRSLCTLIIMQSSCLLWWVFAFCGGCATCWKGLIFFNFLFHCQSVNISQASAAANVRKMFQNIIA